MKYLFLVALTILLTSEICFSNPMVIEPVERAATTTASHHAFLPPIQGPPPAQGVPFLEPTTGYKITRISDVVSAGGFPNFPKGWDGQKASGLHNGYSLYSCVNRTGEYVLSFGTTPMSVLYRLSDCKCLGPPRSKSGEAIGDQAEPRWSRLTSDTATSIYYHVGTVLYRQDLLIGPASERVIKDFGVGFSTAKDNTELSDDGRYGAFHLADNRTVVFDFVKKAILPGQITTEVSGVNVSPDGKWCKLMEPYIPGRYYRIADLANGDTSHGIIRADLGGHGAWCVDYNGDSVEVYQGNSDDWFKAFNPATGETIKIIYMGELGWSVSQHIARMPAAAKGWALISTYVPSDTAWSYNQLFMLEIKPLVDPSGQTVAIAARPRIWRLGHTQGNYSGGYFTESFASIDMAGQNVYWGTNWRGNDNIELYRMELPAGWRAALDMGGGGSGPTPTPVPTAAPTPQPQATLTAPKGSTLHAQNAGGLINLPGPASSWVTVDATPTPTPTPTPIPAPAAPVTIYPTATNFHFDYKQSLGDTTGGGVPPNGYIMLTAFGPEWQTTTSTNLVDTGSLMAFDLSGITGQFKKATLVLTHNPATEAGMHPTGREGIPLRIISGGPFTPVWLRYPDKLTGPSVEAPYDGGSYQNRLQTTGTTQRWSALPSKARVPYARLTGDLTTALSDITADTPRLNFSITGNTSSVDVTQMVRQSAGQLLQFDIDCANCSSLDRFGTNSNPTSTKTRARMAIYGLGAVDKTKIPCIKLEY